MKPTIIFDFDRTTFMTDEFVLETSELLAAHLKIDPAIFRSEIPAFTTDPILNYDFYRHLSTSYVMDPETVTVTVVNGLKGQSFIYPDVLPWLKAHPEDKVRIMTTGRDNYQTIKRLCTPELSDYQFTITQEIKGELIRRLLETGELHTPLWLVDDNPASFQGLHDYKGVRLIHIARPGTRYANTAIPEGVEQITGLDQLK